MVDITFWKSEPRMCMRGFFFARVGCSGVDIFGSVPGCSAAAFWLADDLWIELTSPHAAAAWLRARRNRGRAGCYGGANANIFEK
jgi:hypothetical protein